MDNTFSQWKNSMGIASDEKLWLYYEAYKLGKQSKKKKKETHPAYSFCVELWLKEIHPGWSFNGSEGRALNELITQMIRHFTKSKERDPTNQEIFDFFKHFCLKLPGFYKTKKLRILNQDFDAIITEIRTQRTNTRNSGERFSQFAS